MPFSSMVDMRLTPADKEEEVQEMTAAPSAAMIADYPYGLCLCLTHEELDKLDLDYSDADVGDMIDLRAFAKITSKSEREINGKPDVRIELQITSLAVENESTEEPGEA